MPSSLNKKPIVDSLIKTVTIEYLSSELRRQITHHDLTSISGFAIALSGGADSTALVYAAARASLPVVALTVDHGLRTGSDLEAQMVAGWMTKAGIRHHILQAAKNLHIPDAETGFDSAGADDLSGNVQAKARILRYTFLEKWCVDHKFPVLMTAHQKDDMAENFLLRMMRGSGVDGLAAMPAVTSGLYYPDKITRFRPFLGLKKIDLMTALKGENIPFVDDPSNKDSRFERTHVRSFLANSPLKGLTVDRLAETANLLLGARLALKSQTNEWAERCLLESQFGGFFLNAKILEKAPKDIGLRLMSWGMQSLAGGQYKPRLKSLEALYSAILKSDFSGRTLAGVTLVKRKGDTILLTREPSAMPKNVAVMDGLLYDNRWRVTVVDQAQSEGLTLSPLGQKGWISLKKENDTVSDMSFREAMALPAFFRGDHFVALALRGEKKDHQKKLGKTGAFVVHEPKPYQEFSFEKAGD